MCYRPSMSMHEFAVGTGDHTLSTLPERVLEVIDHQHVLKREHVMGYEVQDINNSQPS